MFKLLFCFLLTFQCWAQKLHHQVIASQGINSKISNGMIVSQSVGQVNASIGNYKNSKLIIGQGYIQSFGIAKNAAPVKEVVSMIAFPNPVIDLANFQFSSPIGSVVSFALFDSRGRLVYSKEPELIQNSFAIDLSMVSEGLYFAKITSSNYTFSTKILKSK
jgi:hypothetical protein